MAQKHALKSKTVWGSIISLGAYIIMFLTSKNPNDKYFALTGLLTLGGSTLSIIGRVTAKDAIYFLPKKKKKVSEK